MMIRVKQQLRRWVGKWSTASSEVHRIRIHDDAQADQFDAVVPIICMTLSGTCRHPPLQQHPLDGAWEMCSNERCPPVLPHRQSCLMIQGGFVSTRTHNTCILRHETQPGAFQWGGAILELESSRTMRCTRRTGGCIYYRRVELPPDALLSSLQGHWSHYDSGGDHRLTIERFVWKLRSKKMTLQGLVHRHMGDEQVVINGHTAVVTSSGNLMLHSCSGFGKKYVRMIQCHLYAVQEDTSHM